ncbi:MAG: serine/threonine protein kinase, partial [Phycisphaerales bacterium]|nr:serine/threonine protein kinase [Phycisphaerales bacterium]
MKAQIGPYNIESEAGRGGMGVVYRARDSRLDRVVAIKSLPEAFASDPVRLDRFEREARTLAQVTHTNIAGIYGIEEQDGARFLVLEYVEGETLAEVLERGPLSPDDAVEIAAQVADGVAAAHDAGVVHRDLKPGNVIITPDGRAKVLDFGLARSDGVADPSSAELTQTPTATYGAHSPTIPGAILGTAPYMSPEQARGKPVDKRTDIWSFGVMLYEMLTGIGPFHAETATESIGAILHKSIDLNALPSGTPPNVRRVLGRCLERDKDARYR